MAAATILVERDGSYADASPRALELLGVTIEQLRALPPHSLSGDRLAEHEIRARQAAFAATGTRRAIGSATIQRPDGRRLRVRFLVAEQPDGRFLAHLRPVDEDPDKPPVLVTVSQVLAGWRAAERRLESLEPGSPEWQAVEAEIGAFRSEYRRLTGPADDAGD